MQLYWLEMEILTSNYIEDNLKPTRERMYFRQKTLKIFICYIMQLKTV